ncbi:MAG: acyl CoA:acetate/3-ketoacid CoA transferase [Gammaproteobacteria bacterium]|nr:acyl CoA:acetate/3-ketoacid CoA transferase [Gammaproteobacteria bacterium]NIP89280.1 acyl CoA:acetate/3-ketoacid CoA transferase [Gammaproteobacteria bacterium]NIR24114.1 acyl CoA:acetate/3-ketoacid CoA transferase [Gammaproteobacteria bacterium]NIS05776.1 acyl CoA:acetate/3-ketoacid CoA transferase [Gammaproteobacteria bacterium]NIV48481.1 acyl CoA:acetate/3-ketoacid CoA transferase [Gammaproteobacteria bacterium]
MSLKKVISAPDAIAIVQDEDVLATSGYGGHGTPDELLVALEQRFLESGSPRNLTLVFAGGQGDGKTKGLNHLGHEGLLKRVIGGHYGLIPAIEKLAVENRIEAYNIPEGVITHLYRDIASGKPGTLSRVGLGTFVDPREEGGKVNEVTRDDIVQLVELGGKQSLFYQAFPINVAFIRGTTADPEGNVTMEKESLLLENLSMAIAAKNSGGYVICQVERVAQEGSLDSRQVRIPGVMVDCVVVAQPEHHMQSYGTQYNPAFSGEVRVPLQTLDALELDERKIIARRAALELAPNSIINLGIGLPDCVGAVAAEEKVQDLITLTVDPGIIGGVPMGGLDFGAAVNSQAVIDHGSQFDFIDGGGLDAAFLGMAEADRHGNVNASRFGRRLTGCGGFINISQNSQKVIFLSTFSSSGLKIEIAQGQLRILQEGTIPKLVDRVGQITFSGKYAAERHQEVLYITERCVFRLGDSGLELIEVAPGIDIERDILSKMPFTPLVHEPTPMEAGIFRTEPMGLRDRFLDIHIEDRISYDAEKNTLFLDFSGMRVRTEADLEAIKKAVDATLAPLGKRVYSIVNYERFVADDDIVDKYMDLVKYVEDKYYISVSRYTSSGFLRLKLGKELSKRRVSSRIYESGEEAALHLTDK